MENTQHKIENRVGTDGNAVHWTKLTQNVESTGEKATEISTPCLADWRRAQIIQFTVTRLQGLFNYIIPAV
jgi:hypothetical protein